MATTLNTYILQARRLLHDANAQFWTDVELTDYANEARSRVVQDTGCLRTLQSFTLTAAQEAYAFTVLPSQPVLDIINIAVIWGTARYTLDYYPWTQFTSALRPWQTYQQMPVAFSVYGQGTFYLGPNPDQNYACEIDTIILPNDLIDNTTVEQIKESYQGPIKYYMAYLAKLKEQSMGEAERYKGMYTTRTLEVQRSIMTRRITTMYGSQRP